MRACVCVCEYRCSANERREFVRTKFVFVSRAADRSECNFFTGTSGPRSAWTTCAKTVSRECDTGQAAGVAKPPSIMHSPRTRYQGSSRRGGRPPHDPRFLCRAASPVAGRRSPRTTVAAVSDARVPGA